VIIGNGGAGVSALQAMRQIDTNSKITIISKEKYPAYSPCSLPNLLAGEIDKEAILRFDKDFYNRMNAKFMKNSEAVNIDANRKEVELASGKSVKYDKLLLANGSSPIVPKLQGLDLNGVHVMGTLASTIKISEHVDRGVKHAVVVGGGFMGVETAMALRTRGIKVTIIELLPGVLSRMLDPDVSGYVESLLKENGINLILNNAVKAVIGKKEVSGVSLDKANVECDMVVVSIGVMPNTALVNSSGIKVGRGIMVDQTMRTSAKDIFAAGDIAEVNEQIAGGMGSFAIWPNAIEQGRIAGLNMAGEGAEYAGAEIVNILNVFDTPIIAMGHTSGSLKGTTAITRQTPRDYKKLLLKDDRMVGLQFVGSIKNTGPLYALMKRGADIAGLKDRLLDDNLALTPDCIGPKQI
jgi:NAD(P)H-nitrite reductase large subunit